MGSGQGKQYLFVPLRILCEDGEYLDGVNITGPDIYQRLHNGELPQTSLPRVEDFSAKLREIFDLGYDGVIAVMLSSGLSGTYNLARILAGECAEQGYAMKVFDSVSGALGQGMTVLQLAEDIKNGMDWEELTERRAPQLIANTYPFFSVDTLEYLVKAAGSARSRLWPAPCSRSSPSSPLHRTDSCNLWPRSGDGIR